jgi:hypothetical protein
MALCEVLFWPRLYPIKVHVLKIETLCNKCRLFIESKFGKYRKIVHCSMTSYSWYQRKYFLSNGFHCISTSTSASMKHNLKIEDWWKPVIFHVHACDPYIIHSFVYSFQRSTCGYTAHGYRTSHIICIVLYFRRYVLWYWWKQFEGDLGKTIIQMFYGDCVEMCEAITSNFDDKRLGCYIMTMHHLTLPFSPGSSPTYPTFFVHYYYVSMYIYHVTYVSYWYINTDTFYMSWIFVWC